MLIITLSTIPPRFHLVGSMLKSLLAQTAPIHAIELWVPQTYRRFPGHAFCLPEVPEGVSVRVAPTDLGPATKILPAAAAHANSGMSLLYCDDDQVFHRDWAQGFLDAAARQPDCAIAASGFDVTDLGFAPRRHAPPPRAKGPDTRVHGMIRTRHRWRRMKRRIKALCARATTAPPSGCMPLKREGYVDILEGFAGGLVRPNMFVPEDAIIPDRLWAVDDIWLSGMLARKGLGIWGHCVQQMPQEVPDVTAPLQGATIGGLDRDKANRACVRYLQQHYGVWV